MPHCEKHGEFQSAGVVLIGDRKGLPACPRCAVEYLEHYKATGGNATAINAVSSFIECIPPRYKAVTLDNFRTHQQDGAELQGLPKLKGVAIRFVDSFGSTDKNPSGMIFVGPPGVGKTHLAIAIGREIANMGLEVIYTTVSDMVKGVRAGWGDGGGEDLTQSKYIMKDLLIIDEIGVQTGSDNEKKIIFEVIAGRYDLMKPTIIISNLDEAGVTEYITERCVSRLLHVGYLMPFECPSYREMNRGAA